MKWSASARTIPTAAIVAILLVTPTDLHGWQAAGETIASADKRTSRTSERATIEARYGVAALGELAEGDAELRAGEWRDLYHFIGEEGDPLSIELSSSDFAPYLAVIAPSGRVFRNPNHRKRMATRINLRLREGGRYQVVVTSRAPGESGEYALRIMDRRVRIAQ